jgi:hypothetical protein
MPPVCIINATNTLIKPFAVEMTTCGLRKQWKKKTKTVQLYSNTVTHRIQDLSEDTEKQLVSLLKSSLLFCCNLTNQQGCEG